MADPGPNPSKILSTHDERPASSRDRRPLTPSSLAAPAGSSVSSLPLQLETTLTLEAGGSKENTLVPPNPIASDDQADMPASGKRGANPPRREADFSNLLTPAEKHELVSLINKVTDGMQKQYCQVFDSARNRDDDPTTRPTFWDKLPARLRDLSLTVQPHKDTASAIKTNPSLSQEQRSTPGQTNRIFTSDESQKPPTEHHTTALNLSVDATSENIHPDVLPRPILQELKKEFLANFRKWQGSIARRVNEVSAKAGKHNNRGRYNKRGPSGPRGLRIAVAPKTCMTEMDEKMRKFYPPLPNSLSYLPMEKKRLILHAILLLVISLEHYQSYSRTLMLNIASSLHVPIHVLLEDELRLGKTLAETVRDIEPAELMQRRNTEAKSSKKWKTGVAGTNNPASSEGCALAAHLLAAGIGTVSGGLGIGTSATAGTLAAVASSTFVIGTLFGLCIARPSGKPMEQLAKEIPAFALRSMHAPEKEATEFGRINPESRRLRVVIGVSGWLKDKDDVTKPWHALGSSSEVYALQWDPEALAKMGCALETVLKSAAWSLAKKEIVTHTMRTSLHEGTWPQGLLKMSKTIDNPWTMGMVRADKTGYTLAEMIINKAHGERSITLIGYSLGARVIYSCLMNLAEKRAFGLVENAILMGAPAPSGRLVWGTMKSVVSTRLVNVYSENDYVLGFLYRTSSLQYGIAGLQRIDGIEGVENVDVTAKIGGHLRYRYLVGSILDHIGWEDIDREVVDADETALAVLEERGRERGEKRDAVELNLDVPVANGAGTAKGEEENEAEGIIRTRVKKKKRKGKGKGNTAL